MENLPSRFELLLKALDENEEIAYKKLFELRDKINNFLRYNDGGRFGANYELFTDQALDEVDDYLRKGKEVRDIKNLTYQIAKNKWTKFYKEQSKLIEIENSGAQNKVAVDFAKTFEDKELERKTYECLYKCLGQFPDKDRDTLLRFYDDDFNNEELADEIGTNYNNLKKKMFELRKKLKCCIEKCMKNRK